MPPAAARHRVQPARASAAAVVVVITIIWVLDVSPPANGPAKLAYSPCTGFTPTSTAEAMPSGTLLIAPGNPATRPCGNAVDPA